MRSTSSTAPFPNSAMLASMYRLTWRHHCFSIFGNTYEKYLSHQNYQRQISNQRFLCLTHPALHHHLLRPLHHLVGHRRRLPATQQTLALRTRKSPPGVSISRPKCPRHRKVHRLCLLVFGSASPVSSPPEDEAAEEGEAEDEGQHDQGDGEGGQLAWNLRPWKRNDRK